MNYCNRINIREYYVKILPYFVFTIMLIAQITFLDQQSLGPNNLINNQNFQPEQETFPHHSSSDQPLFQGNEKSLNITDYATQYSYDQEIEITNTTQTNLSYYLDQENNWKASQIQFNISKIKDNRDWISNPGFQDMTIFRKNETIESTYSKNKLPGSVVNTINEPGAQYIRAHFQYSSFERYYDYLYLFNESLAKEYLVLDGYREDFYSPWIPGDTIEITYSSDGSVEEEGYSIDYYEFLNSSSNYEDSADNWGFNNEPIPDAEYVNGFGTIDNSTAIQVGLYSELISSSEFNYTEGKFSEVYQNLTIPRGEVHNAYISFEYYLQNGMDTNENFMYCQINDKRIYSKGISDIIELGRNEWHNTGRINLDLWVNSSNIFDSSLMDNTLNISVGFMSGKSISYNGFQDGYQNILWFDNLSLELLTSANSTQEDINLTFDDMTCNDQNIWGSSTLYLSNQVWEENSISVQLNTSSPSLSFILDTKISGFHQTTSKVNEQNKKGVNYEILENGTILWTFYHNFYMPSLYTDFRFEVEKPLEWQFLEVYDPTLNSQPCEGGGYGDSVLEINSSYANYPGWWKFVATSPNYIHQSTIKLEKNQQSLSTEFRTHDNLSIIGQINHSNFIPAELGNTQVNLTIYNPEGEVWHEDFLNPLSNGSFEFSKISFSSLNATGGYYNFTLFWSNHTALGGIKSQFLVIHNSSIILLKPEEAKKDFTTDAFLGDIIPIRLQYKDAENNNSITKAQIKYNWTNGVELFAEIGTGIYETILDTSDLGKNGFYSLFINASQLGFEESNFSLVLKIVEPTNLQRVESEYYVELHDNFSLKYQFTNSSGGGINNAVIELDLDSTYYKINDYTDGNYTIWVNTSYIEKIGVYQLKLNFTKENFETQSTTIQFEIVEQTVNITTFINDNRIEKNAVIEAYFKEIINISVRVQANIDKLFLTDANLSIISKNYEKELIEQGTWFNLSLALSASNFSDGLNFVYISFVKENYAPTNFGLNLLIAEQPVNLSVTINGEKLLENTLLNRNFQECINISVQAYAIGEKSYLSDANITLVGKDYQKTILEIEQYWYNESLILDEKDFEAGINYLYIEFKKDNYTSTSFSFQLFLQTQTINLTVFIDGQEIQENTILEYSFNDFILLSAKAFANTEKKYLTKGIVTFIFEDFQKNLTQVGSDWYNTSLHCSSDTFSIGINYVYLRFQQNNYTTSTLAFQLIISQIDFEIKTIDFQDSIEVFLGDKLNIEVELYEEGTNRKIDKGKITYTWDFGIGSFEEKDNGMYSLSMDVPENSKGSYTMTLIVSKEGSIYKSQEFSIVVVVSEKDTPDAFMMIFISSLIAIVTVLGLLSIRSYILIPRKRKKEAELMQKTQRFKDMNNIQAVVIIDKHSGIPLYMKSFSILSSKKKELFSGFIQAITSIGEEFTNDIKTERKPKSVDEQACGVERMIELDFKYFHCLITDREDIRIVFILRNKVSERLKEQVSYFSLGLCAELGDELPNWGGQIDIFETLIPPILGKFFELHYKGYFILNKPQKVAVIRQQQELSSMETRELNVIYSFAKGKEPFKLNRILDLVHEDNNDLVIEGIEGLINKKIIIPSKERKKKKE